MIKFEIFDYEIDEINNLSIRNFGFEFFKKIFSFK